MFCKTILIILNNIIENLKEGLNMNLLQELILGLYIFLTIKIFKYHCKYGNSSRSKNFRLRVRFSMLIILISIICLSKYIIINPWYIGIAFGFTVIADHFFNEEKNDWAIKSFIVAYFFLFLTFRDGFTSSDLIFVTPFLVTLLGGGFYLRHYIISHYLSSEDNKSNIFVKSIFVIVWLLAICALITTSCRGFSLFVSALTLITGILLFISDIFVAFDSQFVCWKKNVIWGTYMAGWTFLLLVVSDSSISLF